MTILCYHAVDDAWGAPIAVTRRAFADHAAWLASHRRVVPLDEAIASLDRRGRLPRGHVAVTFDDGFASVLDEALPVLRRHGIAPTAFLIAEALAGRPHDDEWLEVARPASSRFLTLAEAEALRDAGVAIGSHSLAHRDLRALGADACERDLRESREMLEDMLRVPVRSLAYPKGRHDETVRRAAERAGYSHAFSLPTSPEPAGPFSIPRVGVYRGNGTAALALKTSRWYLRARTSPVVGGLRRSATARRAA